MSKNIVISTNNTIVNDASASAIADVSANSGTIDNALFKDEDTNQADASIDTGAIVNCTIITDDSAITGTITADIFTDTGKIADESSDEETNSGKITNKSSDEETDITVDGSKADKDDCETINTAVDAIGDREVNNSADVRKPHKENNMILFIGDEAANRIEGNQTISTIIVNRITNTIVNESIYKRNGTSIIRSEENKDNGTVNVTACINKESTQVLYPLMKTIIKLMIKTKEMMDTIL